MKQIPNLFTLLNLIFGCIAIVFIVQTQESILSLDELGATMVNLPERIPLGALFIFGAAVIDFLDGFLARWFRASSEMGKQLDSLSDVVSFGVAPGMILYQLLRMSYAQEPNGLDTPLINIFPAFIFTAAAAWRLAKFNISTNQTHSFRGVPSPAAGLLVASFPLILSYSGFESVKLLFINKWFLYAVILLLSWLMVSDRTFMAMKFKDYSFQRNTLKYLLLLLGVIAIFWLKWLAIPVIFILYLLFSAFSKDPDYVPSGEQKEEVDSTI